MKQTVRYYDPQQHQYVEETGSTDAEMREINNRAAMAEAGLGCAPFVISIPILVAVAIIMYYAARLIWG